MSGFGSASLHSSQEGIVDIIKKLKELTRRGPRKINAEASPRLVERAIIVRWGETATLTREPLRGREKGKNE